MSWARIGQLTNPCKATGGITPQPPLPPPLTPPLPPPPLPPPLPLLPLPPPPPLPLLPPWATTIT